MSRKVINVVTGNNMSGLNINIPTNGKAVEIDLLTAENVEYILGMDLATFFEKAKNIDYCVFNLVVADGDGQSRESYLSQKMARGANNVVIYSKAQTFGERFVTIILNILIENGAYIAAIIDVSYEE